jgi:drug/metabolite transporter (DMT)-like permease
VKRDPLAYATMLVLASIWGYNWVVIKVATHDADAFSVSAIRTVVGAICLFGALIATRHSLRPPSFWPTLSLTGRSRRRRVAAHAGHRRFGCVAPTRRTSRRPRTRRLTCIVAALCLNLVPARGAALQTTAVAK